MHVVAVLPPEPANTETMGPTPRFAILALSYLSHQKSRKAIGKIDIGGEMVPL